MHYLKLWGGRFTEPTDAFVEAFTASVGFDQRLYACDIAGSIAHARMLTKVGVLTEAECKAIVEGLKRDRGRDRRGEFRPGRSPWKTCT
jgi:argininosuccinate lyase